MDKIIYTSQFINWFGNWEEGINSSQVVDEKGYPLVVYHGTESEFNEFKSEFMGKTGTALGQGFYFTSNKDDAGAFGKIVKAFYLNIKKPLSGDKLTMTRKEITKLVDMIDKTQCANDPEFGYGILSDFGDVDYEGRNNVLRSAVQMLMQENSDVELVGGLINGTGDYDLVVNVLRKTLGYDGIICKERDVYVIHHANQAKTITNTRFNSDSNDMNESRRKIYLNESQFQLLTQYLKENKKG
jgi:hypothetical protein